MDREAATRHPSSSTPESSIAKRCAGSPHGTATRVPLSFPDVTAATTTFASSCRTTKWRCAAMPTLGTIWLLDQLGLLPRSTVSIATLSGPVQARVSGGQASVSQPRVGARKLRTPAPCSTCSACTFRPPTFAGAERGYQPRQDTIPLRSMEILNSLRPDFARFANVCDAIGSTGLYPFAVVDRKEAIFSARQFPRSSGYSEDAATGIAATALAWSAWELGLTSKPSHRRAAGRGDGTSIADHRGAR